MALRGEDFSVDSEAAAISIGEFNSSFHVVISFLTDFIIYTGEIHRRIRSRVIDHLRKCAGNALIIFDEVQKVAPGALEALMPGLRERGSFSTSSIIKNILGKPVEIHEELSTANCIFLFISDIGADKTESQLLYYGDRNKIPQSALRSAVKGALDEQWKRLNFGTTVKEVIPFLSMEKEQIEEVFRLKLQGIAEENRNIFWADLIVDHSVVDYLSGPEFIRYRHLSQRFPIPVVVNEETDDDLESTDPGSNSTSAPPQQYVTRTKTFATMGGRSLENAGNF